MKIEWLPYYSPIYHNYNQIITLIGERRSEHFLCEPTKYNECNCCKFRFMCYSGEVVINDIKIESKIYSSLNPALVLHNWMKKQNDN